MRLNYTGAAPKMLGSLQIVLSPLKTLHAMKQMIISRILSAFRGKSLLAVLMCLMLVIAAPLPMLGSEQHRGGDKRSEQRTERRQGDINNIFIHNVSPISTMIV